MADQRTKWEAERIFSDCKTLIEWFELESRIQEIGFERALEFAGLMRGRGDPIWWAERAAEIGTEYIPVHKYLVGAKYDEAMRTLKMNAKVMTRAPVDSKKKEKIESIWKLFKGDAPKTPLDIVFRQHEDEKKTAFKFECGMGYYDEDMLEQKSITFPTISKDPWMSHTLNFPSSITEYDAVVEVEKWLSEPLDQEYYEARKQYLTNQASWEDTPYKTRGDLFEASVTIADIDDGRIMI